MVRFYNVMVTLLLLTFASLFEGRVLHNTIDASSTSNLPKITKEEKVIIRGVVMMGSRPPRCEGRCDSCGGHCKAVQIPSASNLEYARGDISSDYKPIIWKCKCGNSLFNP